MFDVVHGRYDTDVPHSQLAQFTASAHNQAKSDPRASLKLDLLQGTNQTNQRKNIGRFAGEVGTQIW